MCAKQILLTWVTKTSFFSNELEVRFACRKELKGSNLMYLGGFFFSALQYNFSPIAYVFTFSYD